jgi:hypothetical protein
MKSLEIIKDTEDLRPNRTKVLKKGTRFQCLDSLADQYLKKKLAKEVTPDIIKLEEDKQAEEAEETKD